jgi:hypothetical protein
MVAGSWMMDGGQARRGDGAESARLALMATKIYGLI